MKENFHSVSAFNQGKTFPIYLFIHLFNHLADRLCIYLAIYVPSTFEDRSHVFNLVPHKGNLKTSQPIKYILGIGKRGNIEEAFPSMEYRFVPEKLTVTTDQYVCFAWAGKSVHPYSRYENMPGRTHNHSFSSLIFPFSFFYCIPFTARRPSK